jgi:uncharacterized protein (TIGR03083 family)
MPADEAKEAIATLRRLHDELVEFTAGLDESALNIQSACSEWTVADVLGHLGSAAELGLTTVTTGRSDMDAAPAIWDRWNAMTATEKASNFVAAEERLVQALEGLDDQALADTRVDLVFLPQPVDVAFLVGMRLSEMGLHRWDVEAAFDPSAMVAGYVVPFILARLPMFAGFFAKPSGKAGRVDVRISDPARNYVLELKEDGASLGEGQAPDAPSRLVSSGEAFLRLTSGRLSPRYTPAMVTVEGDISLDDLRRTFPGY